MPSSTSQTDFLSVHGLRCHYLVVQDFVSRIIQVNFKEINCYNLAKKMKMLIIFHNFLSYFVESISKIKRNCYHVKYDLSIY